MAEGKQVINPPGLFNATALGFSQAVRVGETVYCSGQVSMGGAEGKTARDIGAAMRDVEGWVLAKELATLVELGELCKTERKPTSKGGRPATVYSLSTE